MTIVEQHVSLARNIARKYAWHQQYEDLIAIGLRGPLPGGGMLEP